MSLKKKKEKCTIYVFSSEWVPLNTTIKRKCFSSRLPCIVLPLQSNTSFNRDVVKAGTGRRFLGGLLDDTSYCYTLEVSFYSYMTSGSTAPVAYTEETCILGGVAFIHFILAQSATVTFLLCLLISCRRVTEMTTHTRLCGGVCIRSCALATKAALLFLSPRVVTTGMRKPRLFLLIPFTKALEKTRRPV